jgi:hypothetical protein
VSGTDDRVEHTFVVAVPVERAWQAFTHGADRRVRGKGELRGIATAR